MKRIHVLTAAALSWPLCALFWLIPNKYDVPYFFTLLCLAVVYFMPAEVEEITEEEFISVMREYAVNRIKLCGDVSTDDLRSRADLSGMKAPHTNVWSKILTRPMFVKSGEVKSRIPSNDGRKIGVYRLAGEV